MKKSYWRATIHIPPSGGSPLGSDYSIGVIATSLSEALSLVEGKYTTCRVDGIREVGPVDLEGEQSKVENFEGDK